MRSVELKLLIESVGTYTLLGRTKDVSKEVTWERFGSAKDRDGVMDIIKGFFQVNDKNVHEIEKKLLTNANRL